MQRVLITGMSGVGKSSVIAGLRALGHKAVDTDYGGWLETVPVTDDPCADKDATEQLLHEACFRSLLASEDAEVLFVSCTTRNQGQFYPEFDHIVLLSAPPETLIARLQDRTDNPYGKKPDELADTLEYLRTVGPLLRSEATLEIDTRTPLDEVITTITELIHTQS